MGENRSVCRVFVRKFVEESQFDYLSVDGRVTLTPTSKGWYGVTGFM
jgi:hypothetical protein